jgi:hypothetical protein
MQTHEAHHMKKANQKKRSGAAKQKGQAPQAPAKKDRRTFLTSAGTIAGAAILLGGIGFWGTRAVQASVAERDLTQIGQGIPTIVQVHDAQCTTCVALQREVRSALKAFDDTTLDYRVADIKTEDGLAFASQYGAVHSTLLLFDANGALSGRLVGPIDRARLALVFAEHRDR